MIDYSVVENRVQRYELFFNTQKENAQKPHKAFPKGSGEGMGKASPPDFITFCVPLHRAQRKPIMRRIISSPIGATLSNTLWIRIKHWKNHKTFHRPKWATKGHYHQNKRPPNPLKGGVLGAKGKRFPTCPRMAIFSIAPEDMK